MSAQPPPRFDPFFQGRIGSVTIRLTTPIPLFAAIAAALCALVILL
jgi:hypothetical protein